METRMNKEELIELINSLKLNKNEYWILSSSALVLRGIYDSAGDLDIAVTQKGLDELNKNYNLIQKENGWFIVNDKIECVLCNKELDKVERIDDYNLQAIHDYYEYLINSDRDKDKQRIPLVEEYIQKQKIK